MRRNLLRTIALLTAATFAIPAPAQTDIDPPKTGMIRLTSGQYLDIGKPRKIGGMDYVDSIVYRPGTHRIATVEHRVVDGHFKCDIELVQGDSGSKDTLVSSTTDFRALYQQMPFEVTDKVTPAQLDHVTDVLETNWDLSPAVYTPKGWSHDGRYLIAEYVDLRNPESDSKTISIDALNDPPAVRNIAIDGYTLGSPYWSPDRTRVAFFAISNTPNDDPATAPDVQTPKAVTTPLMFAVYNPATGEYTKIVHKGGLVGWLDNDTLLLHVNSGQKGKPYLSHSLKTGGEQALTDNDVETMQAKDTSPDVCPTHPELVTQFADKTITEGSDTQTVHSLWLKQIGAPGLLSSVAIAAEGRAQDKSLPQVAWASDGKQFAYVLGGDLYVVDVTDHQPTDEERLAAGEDLPCDKMQRIAMSSMKQIGLGILQYTQDYDEHLPPAANVDDVIYPYIKSKKVYSVGRYHWIYMAPADLSFVNMQSPATTPIGRIDLPCGPVILYGDGHVKSGDGKSDPGPEAGNDSNSGIPGDSPE